MTESRAAARQSGFTLLEMIVVLVLVAFITTLLMQGMFYVAQVNDRFLRQGEGRQVRELAFGWFSDAVSHLAAPVNADTSARFRGDSRSFEGVTTLAADRRAGIPVPFAYRIEADAQEKSSSAEFIYVRMAQGSRWPLMKLPGDARFQYQDAHGGWHEDWPPEPALADRLPEAVALSSTEGSLFVLASVLTPRLGLNLDDR
ncbi:hypothetical protein D9M71_130540 [compost metagenome]|uniref:General secretion pathway protein J n=1 Tax=Pseudomonas jinjuensis TaxID=198616 RepID=A0A1G9YEK0_9PSED|nr:type II secretion system protein [Pseudomonas jinjuensis]SDN07492.1 general secretion pathway protein J [Pseudomonas jinjuensis]